MRFEIAQTPLVDFYPGASPGARWGCGSHSSLETLQPLSPPRTTAIVAWPPNATGVLNKPPVIYNKFCGFTLNCSSKNIIKKAGRKCCQQGTVAWGALIAGLLLSAAHSQHGTRLFKVTQCCRMPMLPAIAPAPRDAQLGAGAGGVGPFLAAQIHPVLHKPLIQIH